MNVLALTIFVTLWLAGVFVFFFIYQQRRGAGRSEQDALRPLDEDGKPGAGQEKKR